jgi:hypothetical protein
MRFYHDCFVLENKEDAIYVHEIASNDPN